MKSSPWAVRGHGESHAAHPVARGADELVIRLPHPLVLSVIARSMLVTTVILAFPWLRSILPHAAAGLILPSPPHRWADDPFFLPMLLRDLRREGLLVASARGPAIFLGNPGARIALVKQNKMFPVMTEIGRMAVPDHSVDFVLDADGFCDASFVFVDRILRIGGVAIIRLSVDPSRIFHLPTNYKIVYIRQFGSTIVGIKKMTHAIARLEANSAEFEDIRIGRKLLAVPEQIDKLPKNQIGRKLLAQSNSNLLRASEYALLGLALDLKSLAMFHKKIKQHVHRHWAPCTNEHQELFEVIILDIMEKGNGAIGATGIAEWLLDNASQDEFELMTFEAEVIEELPKKTKAIGIVDEFLLKRTSQWPYWECSTLYGRLRNEVVAVRQWFEE
ncbi:uncharacterized protein LOC121989323 [Zingiber officinale]|uniref:DUF7870 domain-containing protein n=1 Tax=Zingiber officinale TaxID=94328 RepID=A0A8J5IGM3_ZINOF|nr:uncharacterized protein LOC121989323 [Zingiber officinale]KAG6534736.1 hypothetical protein ZIOFF_008639 [Zingiber officinale]